MPINYNFYRHLGRLSVTTLFATTLGSVWAQTCEYSITTAPSALTPPVNSVPSLSLIGIALLAVAVAFVAWRRGKFPGARIMALALLLTAATLANYGGGGLVQRAYAAVVGLTNPNGESLTTSVTNGEVITFTNSSGRPLIVSSVKPALAGCNDGSTLAVGGSCSGTAVCAATSCGANQMLQDGICVAVPPTCGVNEVLQDGICVAVPPTCGADEILQDGICVPAPPACGTAESNNSTSPSGCACDAGYARFSNGICLVQDFCTVPLVSNGYEFLCND
ncbi:midcut-by-XrtH protein [Comamonas sp. J-3]|uniref:midcut-by-XrtH protein n=1 Tax=Comamonas trifloxystrobinivorans TaxID=3350256 RepID=UPI00372BE6EF